MIKKPNNKPEILMLSSASCTNCKSLKMILKKLKPANLYSNIVEKNVESNSQLVSQYNIKSVPWIKINDMEFFGLLTEAELKFWLKQANHSNPMLVYFTELLKKGSLIQAIQIVKRNTTHLETLIELISNVDTKMQVRIGITAIFEEFDKHKVLTSCITPLSQKINHESELVRADIAYLISLIQNNDATLLLQKMKKDTSTQVLEIVNDALTERES